MALAKIDDIRMWLKASYRPDLYRDLYESLRWITDADPLSSAMAPSNAFPFWPYLKPKRVYSYSMDGDLDKALPESRLRDTYNATMMMLAKLRSTNIKPVWEDIKSPIVSEARTAYWAKRSRKWTEAINMVAFDGIMTGYGAMQICSTTNPATGKKLTHLKRHRPLNVLVDPYADSVGESKRICFVHCVDVPTAEKMTGLKDLDSYSSDTRFTYWVYGGKRLVQVFEYVSFCEDEDPTRAFIVGGFESDAYKIMPNDLGCLPVAINEFLYVDGMEMPQGAVYLQQHLEVQADAYRKRLQNIADLHAMIALNPDGVSRQDIARIKKALEGRGEMPHIIVRRPKLDPSARSFEVYEGAPVPPGLMELYQLAIQELRTVSGVNELDRGQAIAGADTATEVNLINQRSGAISGFGTYKLSLFFQSLFQKVGMVAKEIDEDPLNIMVDGVALTINDPHEPASSASELFDEDSSVLVAEEEMFGQAHDMQTKQRVVELSNMLGLPGINPVEITKEIVRLTKLDDKFLAPPPGATPGGPAGPLGPGGPVGPPGGAGPGGLPPELMQALAAAGGPSGPPAGPGPGGLPPELMQMLAGAGGPPSVAGSAAGGGLPPELLQALAAADGGHPAGPPSGPM